MIKMRKNLRIINQIYWNSAKVYEKYSFSIFQSKKAPLDEYSSNIGGWGVPQC